MDPTHQTNVDAGDAIVVVSLSLGPEIQLILRKLGGRLPLAAYGTLEPDTTVSITMTR